MNNLWKQKHFFPYVANEHKPCRRKVGKWMSCVLGSANMHRKEKKGLTPKSTLKAIIIIYLATLMSGH